MISVGDLVFRLIRYPNAEKRKVGKKIKPKNYTEIVADCGIGIVIKEIPEYDGIPALYRVRWTHHTHHPKTSTCTSENLLLFRNDRLIYVDGKCAARGKELENIFKQINEQEVRRIRI